tara:strand:- start:192 stop:395 length:204 start_codon:yes stop_codon:yes gene_type:complete
MKYYIVITMHYAYDDPFVAENDALILKRDLEEGWSGKVSTDIKRKVKKYKKKRSVHKLPAKDYYPSS